MSRLSTLGFLLALATCTAAGCNDKPLTGPEEPEEPIETNEHIDPRLQPYVDRYEQEALDRGIVVDLDKSQLSASIDSLGGGGVAGECRFNIQEPNELVVDATLWANPNVSETLREYIVFHELGHCERRRKHREDADRNNVCLSIMASGVGGCRDVYNATTRSKLLDELFDPSFYNDIE